MQERQRIQAQLQRMREECVRDYLEDKLQQITSKEVIHDILQEFLQVNNQEFLASIADNIQQAKHQNRTLKAQLQELQEQAELRLQQTTEAISQQCQQTLMEELASVKNQYELRITQLTTQIQTVQASKKALQEQRQKLLVSLKTYEGEAKEVEKLRMELAESKTSFLNFKQSCQRIIYQGNREKEREKQRLIEEWKAARETLEAQLTDQRSSQVLQMLLQAEKQKVEAKNQEILQLEQTLHESSSQFKELKDHFSSLMLSLEESGRRETEASTQLDDLSRTLQSAQLSVDYLKEENSYLRQEILSFSSRYEKLEKEKGLLLKQALEAKQNLANKIKQHESVVQKHQEEFNVTITEYKTQYEATLAETINQLSKMKEEIESYSKTITHCQNQTLQLTQQNQQLQKANFALQQQLNNSISTCERREAEIQQYEEELIKVKQESRTEIEAIRQTFQTNWNAKNEELIQEKYISHQLTQQLKQLQSKIEELMKQIASLHHQITIKDEKDEYYKLITEQIKALQKKYSPEKQTESKSLLNSHLFLTKESKIFYIITHLQQEIQLLKRNNQAMRGFILKNIAEISTYIQETIAFTIAKTHSHTLPHQDNSLKKGVTIKLIARPAEEASFRKEDERKEEKKEQRRQEKKQGKKDESFNRTVQQRSNVQPLTNNFMQIKKTLKNIEQRYQSIQQENKYYSTHLNSFIKQT